MVGSLSFSWYLSWTFRGETRQASLGHILHSRPVEFVALLGQVEVAKHFAEPHQWHRKPTTGDVTINGLLSFQKTGGPDCSGASGGIVFQHFST